MESQSKKREKREKSRRLGVPRVAAQRDQPGFVNIEKKRVLSGEEPSFHGRSPFGRSGGKSLFESTHMTQRMARGENRIHREARAAEQRRDVHEAAPVGVQGEEKPLGGSGIHENERLRARTMGAGSRANFGSHNKYDFVPERNFIVVAWLLPEYESKGEMHRASPIEPRIA